MFSFEDMFQTGPRIPVRTTFKEQYHCFSVAMGGRAHLEDGDKILLPPSALDSLARMEVAYPMLFQLTNTSTGKTTHCGVLEFSAEEGRCYLPFWMMQGLLMEEGAMLTVKNVTLPKAKFVKFQAQNVDFLKISNPRAVLEVVFRKFTCVTTGDVICLPYAGNKYYLEVTDVKPDGAASIVEADFEVDFDEPVGYQQSEYAIAERAQKQKKLEEIAAANALAMKPRELQKGCVESTPEPPKFVPFSGAGHRIDGKTSTPNKDKEKESSSTAQSSSSSNAGTSTNSAPTTVFTYQSRIGSKYSKHKNSLAAFKGTGNKLK